MRSRRGSRDLRCVHTIRAERVAIAPRVHCMAVRDLKGTVDLVLSSVTRLYPFHAALNRRSRVATFSCAIPYLLPPGRSSHLAPRSFRRAPRAPRERDSDVDSTRIARPTSAPPPPFSSAFKHQGLSLLRPRSSRRVSPTRSESLRESETPTSTLRRQYAYRETDLGTSPAFYRLDGGHHAHTTSTRSRSSGTNACALISN